MKQLARVSQMLRVWEDLVFLYGMSKALNAKTGSVPPTPIDWALRNYRQLRGEVHKKDLVGFDPLPYLQPEETFLEAVGTVRVMVPVHVASWMAESRRGYRLSRDLQALLNATSLKGVTWSGIPWPSGAFVIGLEEPLLTAKEGAPIDAIMVNGLQLADPAGGPPKSIISFRLLTKRLENAPLESVAKARMEKALAGKSWQTLATDIKTARQRLTNGHLSTFALFEDSVADTPVTDSINDLLVKQHGKLCGCGGTHPEWDQAARLVIGLCLYMDTLPKDSPLMSAWKACPDPVLHGAECATVSTDKPLSSEHRRMFLALGRLEGGSSLPAHIKPGHWRRPPRRKDAEGEDTRTKTVHVRPHIVLRRKAAGNELAGLEHRLEAAEREDAERNSGPVSAASPESIPQ